MFMFGESGAPGSLTLPLCGFRWSVNADDVRITELHGMASLPLA